MIWPHRKKSIWKTIKSQKLSKLIHHFIHRQYQTEPNAKFHKKILPNYRKKRHVNIIILSSNSTKVNSVRNVYQTNYISHFEFEQTYQSICACVSTITYRHNTGLINTGQLREIGSSPPIAIIARKPLKSLQNQVFLNNIFVIYILVVLSLEINFNAFWVRNLCFFLPCDVLIHDPRYSNQWIHGFLLCLIWRSHFNSQIWLHKHF